MMNADNPGKTYPGRSSDNYKNYCDDGKAKGVVNTSSSEMPAGTNVKSAKTQAKKKRTTTRTPIAFVVVVSVFFSVLIVQRDEPKQTDVDCDHDDDGPVGDTRRHVGDEAVIQRTS